MEKLEYIPGDLVMVKKSALQFAKDKIFKVISSLSGGFVKVVMLNDSSTTYSISNNAIRPIPITLGNILYVHQLQHLLFGLELNSEMEV